MLFGFLIWRTSFIVLVLSQRNSNDEILTQIRRKSWFEFRWESTKMASEVPQIKNPKSIMVKPNYAKIIKMIGPVTRSGEQILKSSLWIVQILDLSRQAYVYRPLSLEFLKSFIFKSIP